MGNIAQELADTCLATLQHLLESPLGTVAREVRRYLKNRDIVRLPLAILGNEEDLNDLWELVTQWDSRFVEYHFSADSAEDVCLLEATLAYLSSTVTSCLQSRLGDRGLQLTVHSGLLEGHWCIYVCIPQEAAFLFYLPEQLILFT